MVFDLMLRGGRVLDPGRGTDATLDVAFAGGRVAAMVPRIEDRGAEEVDVAGRLVTPGLIDLHGHFFYRGQPMFTDPGPRRAAPRHHQIGDRRSGPGHRPRR